MDPRVQGRSHPQLAFQIVREAHTTLVSWVSHPQVAFKDKSRQRRLLVIHCLDPGFRRGDDSVEGEGSRLMIN